MSEEIKDILKQYVALNDVHSYRMVLDAAQLFLTNNPNGAHPDDLKLGIELFRHLIELTHLSAMREYEYDYTLQNEILKTKIRLFKSCIPSSHEELRGLTELIVGLKENELGN